MRTVLRWGRSEYETDADLSAERQGALSLGLGWRHDPDGSRPPDLDDVDALVVTSKVRVGSAVLASLRGDLVLTTTSGWDHVDVEAARTRGIAVARLPQARRDAVVEQALASLISLMRQLPALEVAAHRGAWARSDLPSLAPVGLVGARVVVVGLGVIGARMAEVLALLGARVTGVDPAGGPAGVAMLPLEEALADADAVTIHCALTASSRSMFDARRIAGLRAGTVLVNTARGPIVDVDAAVAAVSRGHLRGFAADVFPEEPWPRLAEHSIPGVLLTPHASGFTADLGARVAAGVVEALAAWQRGDPVPYAIP